MSIRQKVKIDFPKDVPPSKHKVEYYYKDKYVGEGVTNSSGETSKNWSNAYLNDDIETRVDGQSVGKFKVAGNGATHTFSKK